MKFIVQYQLIISGEYQAIYIQNHTFFLTNKIIPYCKISCIYFVTCEYRELFRNLMLIHSTCRFMMRVKKRTGKLFKKKDHLRLISSRHMNI